MIRHGGLNWLCGARWTSVSDEAFIDSIKSHVGPLRRCYTGLLRSDGGREKERERDGEGMQRVKGLGEGVGGGGKLAHREATVSLQEQHADTCI